MTEIKNMPELLKLIGRYESIELGEIAAKLNEDEGYINLCKSILTGFGYANTCTLCVASEGSCNNCAIRILSDALCWETDTYKAIVDADTAKELLNAYRDRALYLKGLISDYYQIADEQ